MDLIYKRKKQHIDIVLNKDVEPIPSSFNDYTLNYKALPEIAFDEIETKTKFLDYDISFPFIISSMTGGTKYGKRINENIAKACEKEKIPFGLGSIKILHKKPSALESFDVKRFCPSIPMFANLGLVELNYGLGYEQIQKLIDLVNADGIFFHLNHLQEIIQPEGSTNYKNLLNKFEKLIKKIKVPIIVKEVGHGLDKDTIKRLSGIGIEWFDVSGTGGTSWAWIEGYRREAVKNITNKNWGYLFKDVGIPTADAIINAKNIKNVKIISGGGVRSGIDVLKSISLGASLATAAKPFLKPSIESEEALVRTIQSFRKELKISMFCCGVSKISEINSNLINNKTNLS